MNHISESVFEELVQQILIDIKNVNSKADVQNIWKLLSKEFHSISILRRFISHFTLHEIVNRACDVDKINNPFQTELFHNILVAAVSIPEISESCEKSEYFWNSLKFYLQNTDPLNELEMHAALDVVLNSVSLLARITHRKHLDLILDSKILEICIQVFDMVVNEKFRIRFRGYFTDIMGHCLDKVTHPEFLLVKLRSQGMKANVHIVHKDRYIIADLLRTLLNGHYAGLEEKDPKLSGRFVRKFKSRNFPKRECFVCGKKDNGRKKLKWCAVCKSISYCCRQHQKKDWRRHKKTCKPF